MYTLYIEGPYEDSEFKFQNLNRALGYFSKWCRDERNAVTLYQDYAKSTQTIIKSRA